MLGGDVGETFLKKVVTRRVTFYLAEMPNFQKENLVKSVPQRLPAFSPSFFSAYALQRAESVGVWMGAADGEGAAGVGEAVCRGDDRFIVSSSSSSSVCGNWG